MCALVYGEALTPSGAWSIAHPWTPWTRWRMPIPDVSAWAQSRANPQQRARRYNRAERPPMKSIQRGPWNIWPPGTLDDNSPWVANYFDDNGRLSKHGTGTTEAEALDAASGATEGHGESGPSHPISVAGAHSAT